MPDETRARLISKGLQLFATIERPEHFTDHRHCCECAEHDETLQSHDPSTLGLEQLTPAWDPMCFVSNRAFAYFFPGLARLALEGSGSTYFLDQLLFHLVYDGPKNRRLEAFTPDQRRYVVDVLEHLLATRAEEVELNGDSDRLFQAIAIWSDDDLD